MNELSAIVDKINIHTREMMECKSEREMIETFNYALAAEILDRFAQHDPLAGSLCRPVAQLMMMRTTVTLKTINSLIDLYNSIKTLEASEMVFYG